MMSCFTDSLLLCVNLEYNIKRNCYPFFCFSLLLHTLHTCCCTVIRTPHFNISHRVEISVARPMFNRHHCVTELNFYNINRVEILSSGAGWQEVGTEPQLTAPLPSTRWQSIWPGLFGITPLVTLESDTCSTLISLRLPASRFMRFASQPTLSASHAFFHQL